MNKEIKKHLGCGFLLAAVIAAELVPIYCHECSHVSEHLPEGIGSARESANSTLSVMGITGGSTFTVWI